MSDRVGTSPSGQHESSHNLAASLAAFHRGEPGALDRVLLACHPQMEKLARRMLGVHPEIRRGFGDTCDVAQQAWMRLVKALRDVRPETALHVMRLAYLEVRREISDLARKYGGPRSFDKQRGTNVIQPGSKVIPLIDKAVAPSTSLTSLDDLERFHRAVDRLPQDLRDVFTMRHYLAAKVNDVALAVGCDARTVKRRWAEAKQRLHAALTSP